MVFIGLEAVQPGSGFKKPKIFHINSKYIRAVNEDEMTVTLDDGSVYRITDESLDVFLAAIYGKEE